MKINENEICKYSIKCPYHNKDTSTFCQGATPNRNKIFVCDLVSENGVFVESGFRSKFDETGKMKILMENK